VSPRRKACLSVLADSREILTLARQALYDTRGNWMADAESEGMADDLCTIWVSRALSIATSHVALIGGFLASISRAVDKPEVGKRETDALELLVAMGVPNWDDSAEVIEWADAKWRAGEHVKLGRKR
jgi:hypothetical protein